MTTQTCVSFESMWNEKGRDMRSRPGTNPLFAQTITNETESAWLVLGSASNSTKRYGMKAILKGDRGEHEVDWVFREDGPSSWSKQEFATAFDCAQWWWNIATDAAFAKEIGADYAIPDKFARKGDRLVVFCREKGSVESFSRERYLSIYLTDEIKKNVAMLIPKNLLFF